MGPDHRLSLGRGVCSMAAVVAFVVQHWRLTLGLLLAYGLYVQHLQLDAAESARDAAVAQENVWKNTADDQGRTIKALHDASDARDAKAQQAVDAAKRQQAADRNTITALLVKQPKPGQDRCVAARDLIWQEVSNAHTP